MRGTVKRMKRDVGYGFIQDAASGTDYFFHKSGVDPASTSFDELNEGMKVEFECEDSPKGPRACQVRVV